MADYSKRDDTTAPFNFAISTLQRIDTLITKIREISLLIAAEQDQVKKGKLLYMKYTLVEQLEIESTPLLPEKSKKKVREAFRQIKLIVVKNYVPTIDGGRKLIGKTELYNIDIDSKLNDVNRLNQDLLQAEGYFMPPKQDPSMAWRVG
jgi:hypothetical protein